MRVVLDIVAELMRRDDLDGWADVAATARHLPITSFLCPADLTALGPADGGRVLSTRDAYVTARAALKRIAAGTTGIGTQVPTPPVPSTGPSITAEGDVVRIEFDGRSVRIKRSKGLADLARLVVRPGAEIAAIDLMDAQVVQSSSETAALDATARRQYEDRVRELQTEIERARDDHDLGTAERLQVEMDLIVDELTGALGIGGRARTTAAPSEKARSAVTQRIRSTIGRIGGHHPTLGEHLQRSINTGVYCSYTPSAPVEWTVDMER